MSCTRLCGYAALCITAGLLAWGCSRQPKPDPDLVAKIGNREIRVAEFQDWMRRRAVGNDPAQKAALLQEMLDHFAMVQKAQALGLDQDPELRRSWENMLISKLRASQLEPQLTNAVPTPAQIQAYYQSNLANLTEPAMRRGAILFAEVPAKTSDERKAQLKQRLTEARMKALAQVTNDPAARGFGALAVEYSEDQTTRYRGGDIGWIQAGRGDARFDKLALDTLFALPQSGDLSDVLETPRGYYLVKLTESRAERVKPKEAVQAAAQHQLLLQNQKRLETDWKQSARVACKSEVFPDVLAHIQSPQEPAPSAKPPSFP